MCILGILGGTIVARIDATHDQRRFEDEQWTTLGYPPENEVTAIEADPVSVYLIAKSGVIYTNCDPLENMSGCWKTVDELPDYLKGYQANCRSVEISDPPGDAYIESYACYIDDEPITTGAALFVDGQIWVTHSRGNDPLVPVTGSFILSVIGAIVGSVIAIIILIILYSKGSLKFIAGSSLLAI